MINHFKSFLAIITVAITLFSQAVLSFPTGGGGDCFFCQPYSFGGSTITFKLTSNDNNNLAPITFNFINNPNTPNTGRLCLSGKIQASIVHGSETGKATYELLGSDGSNRGICYSNVTQSCVTIPNADVGAGTAEKCTYTTPALEQVQNVNTLLDGRFKVDTNLSTEGLYADCVTNPSKNICNFEVGFSFNNPIPANLFPATTTLNGEAVNPNVVLYSTEVCLEYQPTILGLNPGSDSLKSKSSRFRACEALAIKTDWCSDVQSATGPSCETTNSEGQLTIGGMNTALGDFQSQSDLETICVNNVSDLQSLTTCPSSIAIAACSGGSGYITFPASYSQTTCQVDGSQAEILSFSPAEGGGTNTVNMGAIGANPDAPGYVGDNTIPAILSSWTAIVSTPDNQPNIWDFSATKLHRVAFIHPRNNDDTVTGSTGDDTILGGSGADTLNGHDGNDILQGGDNVDYLSGNEGNDLLLGYECSASNATCSSYLNNGSDDDVLYGGNGNDCLDGGRGNDTLTGGSGNDAFVLFGNTDSDTFTDFTVGEDVVVDLTGTATVAWVQGKRGEPSFCNLTTGGNNNITMTNVDSKGSCESVSITTTLPAQCAGHPASYQ